MKEDKPTKTLIEQVSDFSNLVRSFHECAKGKRKSTGFQKSLFLYGEKLSQIQTELLSNSYTWKGYREFYITDPKRREIMAAPFMDRVVHHAIHRVIEPIIDRNIPESVYACRKGKGTRLAALSLLNYLRELGENRFTIKLDVKKYFENINHRILMEKLDHVLPDKTLHTLIEKLLNSSKKHEKLKKGIAIGNLTSQLFANFYLVSADNIAIANLKSGRHIRYMDDIVLVGKDKKEILDTAVLVINHVQNRLKLEIPHYKRMPLGYSPIPFMGYLLNHTGYRVLGRNERKFKKRLKFLYKNSKRPSKTEMVRVSIEAFRALEKNAISYLKF